MPRCVAMMFLMILASLSLAGHASVTEYNSFNAWQSAAGHVVTIDFTGYPENTYITDQYSGLGASFTDGLDIVDFNPTYVNDDYGLAGAIDSITVEFSSPMFHIATHHPGSVRFELYNNDQLVYTSVGFLNGGAGFFGGLISTEPFDEARIFDPFGGVFIDDLHFGAVPMPGVLGLLCLAALAGRSRRRPM